MSSHDDAYMDDYDYYQNTGDLAEYFEDDDDYSDDDECEDIIEENTKYQTTETPNMSNIKLKHLNRVTELNDAGAAKFGVKLNGFVFRSINEQLTLFMEFVAIPNKRHSGDLFAEAILYDNDGDIFNTVSNYIAASYFKGVGVIRLPFDDVTPSDISRIVINLQKL